MKKFENKKAVFAANYDKTLSQLVRRFPEVVSVVNDFNLRPAGRSKGIMGNIATIDEYANRNAFSTVDSFNHIKNGFAQNLRLSGEN